MSDREEFEKWYMSRSWVEAYDPLMKHDHGGYIVLETCEAWKAWQAAQAQAGDGEAEYGRGYYDGRKSNIDQVPEFWYEALEKIAQEYEELFIYYKDEREKDGWDSPEHPPILLEVREMLKGFNPPPPASVNQQLLEALFDAAYCLDEAAELIADWGSYASEYFKERHDLKADIILCKNRAASLRAAIAAAQEQK